MFSLLFLLSLCFISSYSITINLSGGEILYLQSHFSTLGIHSSSIQQYNISIITNKIFTECEIATKNNIQNKIIIFYDSIPLFPSCNNDPHANYISLSKILQNNGALGLIIQRPDSFRGGRSIGFSKSISIPVIVVPQETISTIIFYEQNISHIEISPISASEKSLIKSMYAEFAAWWILCIVVYAVLILMFGYLLVIEMEYNHLIKKKLFSHACFMKLAALSLSIITILWVAVDPFGFKQIKNWEPAIVNSLQTGGVIGVYLLILRTWIEVVGIMKRSFWIKVVFSRVCYGVAAIVEVIAVLSGTVWSNKKIDMAYEIFSIVGLLVLFIGFSVFGRSMISTICNSRNTSRDKYRPIYKIGGFIAYYGISLVIGLGVVYLHVRNHIYTLMICTLSHGLFLMVAFSILFMKGRTDLKRRIALKHPTIAKKPQNNQQNIITKLPKLTKSPNILTPANSLEVKTPQTQSPTIYPVSPSIPFPSINTSFNEEGLDNSKSNSALNFGERLEERKQEEGKQREESKRVENLDVTIKYDVP